MTRVALIGLGGIAQSVHLPLLQRNRSRIELAAVAEVSPSRLGTMADRYGIAHRFDGIDSLVGAVQAGQLKLDAAILATGGPHADDALKLVRVGMKVLVEKPLAYSVAELDRLNDGMVADGLDPSAWLRVGYMKEHDPAVLEAKRQLAGLCPRMVEIEVLHPADDRQLAFARLDPAPADVPDALQERMRQAMAASLEAATGQTSIRLQRLYAEVIMGSIIHDIALTRHLGFGLDRVTHAKQWSQQFPGSVTALGVTAAGVPWRLGWHFIADYPEYREKVAVHHELGTVELIFRTPYVLNAPTTLRAHTSNNDLSHEVRNYTWPQEEAFERQLWAFCDLAAGHPQPGSSVNETRMDLSSAQALWNACASTAGELA